MLSKILVVVRDTDPQQPAVVRATLCAGRNTELSLLDVVHEPALDSFIEDSAVYEALRDRVTARRRERLETLVTHLEDDGFDAGGSAIWGSPLDEIVAKRARFLGADLVVLASLDDRGLNASQWRVISTCPAPVLLVKRRPEGRYRRIVAAVDPFRKDVQRADLDVEILEQAHELRGHARLDVVHCRAPIESFDASQAPLPGYTPAGEREQQALEELAQSAGVAASALELVSGRAHEVLTRMADSGETDLIAIGALARGRRSDSLVGSTAERVLHAARCDVLAVKPRR